MSTWIANRIRKARKKQKKFDAKYETPQERWINRRLYNENKLCGGCTRYFSTELENYQYNPLNGSVRCGDCVELLNPGYRPT